jgi:hypothetical protein
MSPRSQKQDLEHLEIDTPPHPYSGCKLLIFFRLQAACRCKIFKTKEILAKYSRIRSYETFQLLLAASTWITANMRCMGTIVEKDAQI